jgi:CheY-like chemotaxis protein
MRRYKILLIEDNEGDILLTEEAINTNKTVSEISIAKNGMLAIKQLENIIESKKEILPDIILLDINLPKKNGQEVLTFIKSNEELKQIPVIMFTTSSTEKDIITSYKNHANCFITKPVDLNDFMITISKIEDFWFNCVKLPN